MFIMDKLAKTTVTDKPSPACSLEGMMDASLARSADRRLPSVPRARWAVFQISPHAGNKINASLLTQPTSSNSILLNGVNRHLRPTYSISISYLSLRTTAVWRPLLEYILYHRIRTYDDPDVDRGEGRVQLS